uniref:Ependymin n=1 Tax=Esox lucius TaxID=8010 RepID=A0A3P8Y9I2_ESOLU
MFHFPLSGSPPLLTGSLAVMNKKVHAFAKYTYDAMGQRIRFKEMGTYENKTFGIDALLLFRKGIMYKIHHRNKTCKKERLTREHFHPMEIPRDATLLGQVVLGSSSGPGQGLLVNTWHGEHKTRTGGMRKYLSTFTEFGCIPVTFTHHTNRTGWVMTTFFNIVIGIQNPEEFIPPKFCKGAELDETEEEADFYSVFNHVEN